MVTANLAPAVAGEELPVQLGGIRRPVGKDEHARGRFRAAGLSAAKRERVLPNAGGWRRSGGR
jgi:hypothetical protein